MQWKSRSMKTIQMTYCKRFDNSCYHHQCIANSYWSLRNGRDSLAVIFITRLFSTSAYRVQMLFHSFCSFAVSGCTYSKTKIFEKYINWLSFILYMYSRGFWDVSETRFRSIELIIGSLESQKIIIGSLEAEKIGSSESEKSGPYRSIPDT